MKFAPIAYALAFMFTAALAPQASARSHFGTDLEGTVVSVDQAAQSAELAPAKKDAPFRFSWNAKTTFLAGSRPADAGILTRGAKVRIRYEKPLFGKTIATKVTLLQPATR